MWKRLFVCGGEECGGDKNNAVLGRAELCGPEDLCPPHSPTFANQVHQPEHIAELSESLL